MKRIAIFAFGLLITFSVRAQQSEMTLLHLYRSVPQANQLNAALFPDYKFTMSLPGAGSHFVYLNNNFLSGDFVRQNLTGGTLQVAALDIASRLKKVNRIEAGAVSNLFHLGLRYPQNYFAIGTNLRAQNGASIPRSALEVLLLGNNNIGPDALDLDPLSLRSMAYLESYFSYGREITTDWYMGARIKLLSGISHVGLDHIGMAFDLQPTGFSMFLNDFTYRSAGIAGVASMALDGAINDLLNDSTGNGFGNLLTNYSPASAFQNVGLSLDIGASYQLDDFLLHAGINDIGFINWASGNTYQLDFSAQEYHFEGFDYSAFENGGDPYASVNTVNVDSLLDAWAPVIDRESSYRTPLPMKMYAGAYYDLADWHRVGALSYITLINNRAFASLSFAYNVKLKRILDVAVTTSLVGGTIRNVGLGADLNLAICHVHFITDNLLAAFDPGSFQNVNARMGINIALGQVGARKVNVDDNGNDGVLDFLDNGGGGLRRR